MVAPDAGLIDPSGLTGLEVWEAGVRTGRMVEVGAGVGANLTRAKVGNGSGLMVSPDCKYIGKAVA